MPILQIQSLFKCFEQDSQKVCALNDVNFSIEDRDIYGIIGLSGAGKSTLIRCLAGLIEPTSGKILFQGVDISHLKGRKLRDFRKSIGMIFQHFNLLSCRTVAGNIAFALEIAEVPRELRQERIDELLNLVGLLEKKNAYPSTLSGGEKQRVGIARALANHPQVLFCDEATSALDPKTTKEILSLLKNLNDRLGVTIILITHEMQVIKSICNKVAVVDKGSLVEQGPVAEIFVAPRHPMTKNFLESASHEIPERFFTDLSTNRKLLRLTFRGDAAKQPIISQMIKTFNVDANILLGWLDNLQTAVIGTLIIALTGSEEGIRSAIEYLKKNDVKCEVIEK